MDWESFYNHFRQPDFVPGFEIQNRLGGGAFGEVYKARKASIGKAYAIKFLKVEGDEQRDAALRELEQVGHFAAIDHPNLVTIEDLGTVMGVPYLIMGYAGEETLAKLLKRGRLEPDAALAYFVQTCRGVLALHDRRLVHFDLKPSNVFIKGDVARVGDYGLSKMMVDGRMTLSFGRGTPQYMAPEMIKNRADHRADIYSLGVMLYECITGKAPFESDVPGALPMREADVPPSFPDAFPERLRVVVEHCLRLDPADRYASVADLLADLGQTARPGDSVRLDLPRMDSPRPSTPASSASSSSTQAAPASSEARSTAAELTRGAVEVARGVWDGLRGTSTTGPRAGSSAGPTANPEPAPAGTAKGTPRGTETTPNGTESTPRSAPRTALPAPDAEPRLPRILRSTAPASNGATSLASAGPGTIPVPPAVEGGALQALGSAITLSFEMLVALVRGLGGGVSGGWSRANAAGRGRSRFVAGSLRLLRLCLFLAVLLALGMLVSFAFFWLVRLGDA
ncbi:MAG: protein kinase [Planctomycetes bacterium]|nr:protein kinase [Planctomycetota bacterium]